MGALANVVNMSMADLKFQELGSKYQPTENKKYIENEKQRQDVIDRIARAPGTISVWLTKDYDLEFNGDIVKLNKGENKVTPVVAVHLLMLFGIENKYGMLYREKNLVVHDEPTFMNPLDEQVVDFTKKAAAKDIK